MRILVTFAVQAEFAPWRKRHAFVPISMSAPVGLQDHFFYRGAVFENQVDVLLTGIGWDETQAAKNPRFMLQELLRNHPDLFISSGLAGGLRPDLECGDIVAAKEVLLRTGGDTYRSSANLLALAESAGALIGMKQITEPHVVSETLAKGALARFGDFVDMEGYHILQIVNETTIPAISVRSISDTRDLNPPVEISEMVDREGHVQTIQLLKLILKRPGRIRSLFRFGAQSYNAAVSLANFLDRFLEGAGGRRTEARAKREALAAQ